MESLTLTALLSFSGASVLITILTQVFKQYIPERYVPFFAVGLGMALVVAAAFLTGQRGAEALGNAALTGILAGLSAIGVYSAQSRVTVPGANRPALQAKSDPSA